MCSFDLRQKTYRYKSLNILLQILLSYSVINISFHASCLIGSHLLNGGWWCKFKDHCILSSYSSTILTNANMNIVKKSDAVVKLETYDKT